jgi:hypothetical protein
MLSGRAHGLAESAPPVEELDLTDLKARIDEMHESLTQQTPGDELDRAIAMLDHYKPFIQR